MSRIILTTNHISDTTSVVFKNHKYSLIMTDDTDVKPYTLMTEYTQSVPQREVYNTDMSRILLLDTHENPINGNMYLMSIKSGLNFILGEEVGCQGLYMTLESSMDPERITRSFYFKLMFNDSPVGIYSLDTLKQLLEQVVKPSFIVLMSDKGLVNSAQGQVKSDLDRLTDTFMVPHWYINAMFKQVVENEVLKGVSIKRTDIPSVAQGMPQDQYMYIDKTKVSLFTGHTGTHYLLYHGEPLTDTDMQDIIEDINSRITTAIRLGLYPSTTPYRHIQQLLLQPTKGELFALPKSKIQFAGVNLDKDYTFDTLEQVYSFLYILNLDEQGTQVLEHLNWYITDKSYFAHLSTTSLLIRLLADRAKDYTLTEPFTAILQTNQGDYSLWNIPTDHLLYISSDKPIAKPMNVI